MAFDLRGILQSMFDLGTESDVESEKDEWGQISQSQGAPSDGTAPMPYTPSHFDGEYNVWFTSKPLGLGLVPSTQMYGTWEVSTIAPAVSRSSCGPTSSSKTKSAITMDGEEHDELEERKKIARGDVIVAVNFSTMRAKLQRSEFLEYLQQTALPIVVTLRKPAIYGTFDSRTLSTAMYPTSIEYHGRSLNKKFQGRASSVQWKRNLLHELSKKKQNQAPGDVVTTSNSPQSPHTTQIGRVASTSSHQTQLSTTNTMSEMGEFTYTFHDDSLHLVLAPSTRRYGAVEIFDAKIHAPNIQIGDVIMAVNNDTSIARWVANDAIEFLANLKPPVTILFRRPSIHRKYLEEYFGTTKHKEIMSSSIARSMYPDSSEYKGHSTKKSHALDTHTQPTNNHDRKLLSPLRAAAAAAEQSKSMSKTDWESISLALASSDQFKLWTSVSNESVSDTQDKAAAATITSSFLTERHVHFLWKFLPKYLTCNGMELVYDTRRHGYNLLSFYGRLEDKGPSILVIRDSRDQIFGAFAPASWKQCQDVYGNGRAFVFTLRPQMRVFPWSGRDQSFMYGVRESLFVGGGTTGSALSIQLDELLGFTQSCETFNSPPLVQQHSGEFDIECMEVWCFSGLKI